MDERSDDKDLSEEDYRYVIESASYEELLKMWRFHRVDSPIFQPGKLYDLFQERFHSYRKEMTNVELFAASKRVGWR